MTNNRYSAIVLSAVMLVGIFTIALSSSSRNAYAHNFSGDESAAFLAKVQELKVETHLIQQDLASSNNKTLAAWHLDKMSEFWNANDTKEMGERNQRLSKEIPNDLANLTAIANSTSTSDTDTNTKVKSIVDDLDNSLAEAVSVRIDKTALDNATVNALVVKAVLDETMEDYGIALGASDENAGQNMSMMTEATSSTTNTTTNNNSNNTADNMNTTTPLSTVVNYSAYQTAQGLAAAAQDIFNNNLKTKAQANATAAITNLDQGFTKLRQAIDNKMSNDDVMAIVHGTIYPNLATAFNLKIEPTMEGQGDSNMTSHNHTNSTTNSSAPTTTISSSIPARFMMYATETAQKIHSDHLSENAPIIGPYIADTKYTLTSTDKAISISDKSNVKDANITLDLATWKSTARVVSMDIMAGSLNIDGQGSLKVLSGQAYYVVNGHVFYVFALITPQGDNSMPNANNNPVYILTMKAILSDHNNQLPTNSYDQPLIINLLSQDSKFASQWFLQGNGQVVTAAA